MRRDEDVPNREADLSYSNIDDVKANGLTLDDLAGEEPGRMGVPP